MTAFCKIIEKKVAKILDKGSDGVTQFTELGTGTVLQGLIRKINPEAEVTSIGTIE